VLTVATATERLDLARPVGAYATDQFARVAAYAVDGRLHRADLLSRIGSAVAHGAPRDRSATGPVRRHIAYVTPDACLRVIGPDGTDGCSPANRTGRRGVTPGGVRLGRAGPGRARRSAGPAAGGGRRTAPRSWPRAPPGR
jgi:hypothetical protein